NRALSQSRFIGGLLAKLNPCLALNVAQIKTGIDGTSQSSRLVGGPDNRSALPFPFSSLYFFHRALAAFWACSRVRAFVGPVVVPPFEPRNPVNNEILS